MRNKWKRSKLIGSRVSPWIYSIFRKHSRSNIISLTWSINPFNRPSILFMCFLVLSPAIAWMPSNLKITKISYSRNISDQLKRSWWKPLSNLLISHYLWFFWEYSSRSFYTISSMVSNLSPNRKCSITKISILPKIEFSACKYTIMERISPSYQMPVRKLIRWKLYKDWWVKEKDGWMEAILPFRR